MIREASLSSLNKVVRPLGIIDRRGPPGGPYFLVILIYVVLYCRCVKVVSSPGIIGGKYEKKSDERTMHFVVYLSIMVSQSDSIGDEKAGL